MRLVESIASYSGESRTKMASVLNDQVKVAIAEAVRYPDSLATMDDNLVNELIEMDVFVRREGSLRPNTAIFLEEDIKMLYEPVFRIGSELAHTVAVVGESLKSGSPNVRNFLGSIIGMGQGLHRVLQQKGLASTWSEKNGKYARSKVDFNEECQAFLSFGADLQIKRVHRGSKYTAVIIGEGDANFISYLCKLGGNSDTRIFGQSLTNYLTDVFPLLVCGDLDDESLHALARASNIDVDDRELVITPEDAEKHQGVVTELTNECAAYLLANMDSIKQLLSSTVVGRQGVPVENMMMNFWRYLRKATALKLYEIGYLNDAVPESGSITVFYDNRITCYF